MSRTNETAKNSSASAPRIRYKVHACEKGLRGFKALSIRFKRPYGNTYVAANDKIPTLRNEGGAAALPIK